MDNYSEELAAKLREAAQRGGGEVVVPAGTYLIGPDAIEENITGVHLRGEGKGATRLICDAPMTTRRSLLTLHGNNWSVSGLTIDCGDFQPVGGRSGGGIGGSGNDWAVHDVEIKRIWWAGMVFSDATDFRIENCFISLTEPRPDFNAGVLLHESNGPVKGGIIKANRLINTTLVLGGNYHWIIGNVCRGFKFGSGVFTTYGSTGMRIESNDLSHGTGLDENHTWCLGIECWSRNSLLAHNQCYNNDGAGINTGAPNCVVIGNICFGNARNGIGARNEGMQGEFKQSADYNLFIGNQSFHNGWYGYAEQSAGLIGIVHGANCYRPNGRGEMLVY
jgi:hypothetical protein